MKGRLSGLCTLLIAFILGFTPSLWAGPQERTMSLDELFQLADSVSLTIKSAGQITAHKRKVLIGKGTVSHAQAIKKAEQEFEICRQRELEMQESDFDRDKETQRKELILSPNLGFGVHARVHGP